MENIESYFSNLANADNKHYESKIANNKIVIEFIEKVIRTIDESAKKGEFNCYVNFPYLDSFENLYENKIKSILIEKGYKVSIHGLARDRHFIIRW